MAASYPDSVKTFTTKVNGVDAPDAAHINDLQLEVAAVETDLLKAPTDYSATSTIVGWTSFTSKVLTYLKIGKLVFVIFNFDGTSNDVVVTATLPFAASGSLFDLSTARDNGGALTPCRIQISGSTLTVFPNMTAAANAWTNSGTKSARGHFFYFTS